ncbi:methyl-accepting chemotaxis protein [Vibrio aestuarianus]|uniref:methyl-accepting chemotaxis protein n=1 Tax=Vibrio aestuarianus TaxID=28171 RepID=UPI00155969DF|nr:methyl-accepting chemotaxis protein [Vibrio aestuarianus]NGZ14671.1 methyl-accepting chemotaxis protein [Vibrio aestuarianus]NKZ50819.1 methyl-accepting chemotaxis protein [Vibrio aestuarianus]
MHRLTIRQQLLIMIISLIVVLSGVLGFGLLKVENTNEATNDVVDKLVKRGADVIDHQLYPFANIRMEFYRTIFSDDARAQYVEKLSKWHDATTANIHAGGKTKSAEAALAMVDAYYEHHKNAVTVINSVNDGVLSQRELDVFLAKGSELATAYNDSVMKYIDFLSNQTKAAIVESEVTITKSILLVVEMVLVAMLIGLIICYWLAKIISNQTKSVCDALEKLSHGDLTVELPVAKGKNEMALLSGYFNLTSSSFRTTFSEMSSIATSVASSSTQLSAVMSQSKANAEEESSQMTQIATAINQMSMTAQEVSHNATQAEQGASIAIESVSSGHHAVKELQKVSDQISVSVQNTAVALEDLKAYSLDINTVVEVIGSVSEQTNLLALNAAIEAARAGEQGRGFAVVADEVRNLAAKTQQSTQNIKELIERLQHKAETTNAEMNSNIELVEQSRGAVVAVTDAFSTITDAVNSITEVNTMVATASEEQSAVSAEISHSIEVVTGVVNQNVVGISQSTTATEELARLAEEQQQKILAFRI